MMIEDVALRQDARGRARVTFTLNVPPSELAETCRKIKDGKKHTLTVKPYRENKSNDQVGAIWGKIGEIADVLFANKETIYEECLRRYGQSVMMRIPKEALGSISGLFRLVDVKGERDDNTIFVVAYKGLSQMDTAEAARLLEGVLDECRELGIPSEVRND